MTAPDVPLDNADDLDPLILSTKGLNPMISTTETTGGLMTAKQAAKYLAVSEKTLWSHTAPRGPLPSVKIGGRVLYDLVDLRAYIEACKAR